MFVFSCDCFPQAAINKASEAWGIVCYRYEIRDVHVPTRIQEAMQLQVEAERKKRAAILESEGVPPHSCSRPDLFLS